MGGSPDLVATGPGDGFGYGELAVGTMTDFSKISAVLLLGVVVAGAHCGRAGAGASARPAPVPTAEPAAATGSVALAPAHADSSGYPFTPAEKAAVDDFLRRHPDLRVATESDRQDSGGDEGDVRRLYGVYHAYFVRGDLNDDGILDFVLAFVRRDSSRDTPWFSVVVFTGKTALGGLTFGSGAFIERDITLARGDLSIDRDAVLITPDISDEAVRRYRWDPLKRSYVFVRDDTDDDDTPITSRT
jgi:hypothetical protein